MYTLEWSDTIYDEEAEIEVEFQLNIHFEIEEGYTAGPMEPDQPDTVDVTGVEVESINCGGGPVTVETPAEDFFHNSSTVDALLPEEDHPYFEHVTDMHESAKADRADQIRDRRMNR